MCSQTASRHKIMKGKFQDLAIEESLAAPSRNAIRSAIENEDMQDSMVHSGFIHDLSTASFGIAHWCAEGHD